MWNRMLVLMFLSSASWGQPKQLTNQDVVRMTQAGLSETVILKQIQSTANQFDVSSSGLVQLKRSHVSDNIIQAMMGIPATTPYSNSPAAASQPPSTPASAGMDQIKKFTFSVPEAHGVYWEAGDKLIAIPSSQRQLTANKKRAVVTAGGTLTALGVKSKSFTRLQGTESAVRVSSDAMLVLHLSEARIPNIKLVKAEVKQGERELVVSSKVYSTESKEENGVEFALVKLKPELYRLLPKQPLDRGEYAVIDISSYNQSAILAYDFGVN